MKPKISMSSLPLILMSLAVSVSAISCGPSVSTLSVELRHSSRSGIDLAGKSLSVAYLDDGNSLDSSFIASVAEGFAGSLESEYFSGEPVIKIYNVEKNPGADYSCRDSMINVLVSVGTDVLFLFDSPVLGDISLSPAQKVQTPAVRDSAYVVEASVPYSVRLFVYDALDRADRVRVYSGASAASPVAYTDGTEPDSVLEQKALSSLSSPGLDAGEIAGRPFLPVWNEENLTFFYFGASSGKWIDAIMAAHYFDWSSAIRIWSELAASPNLEKRSCAAYNLASVFYIIGQYSLAKDWLDISDESYPVHLSYGLRKKIESRL